MLLLFVPSFGQGIKGLMTELGQLPAGPPDMGKVAEIFKTYKTEFVRVSGEESC